MLHSSQSTLLCLAGILSISNWFMNIVPIRGTDDGGLPDKEKEEQKDFKFYLKFSPPPTKIFNRNILQFISLLSVNTEKRVYWLTSSLLFLLFS